MNPGPITDRLDLIEMVSARAPSSACRRACLNGKVEVLGGFRVIPPSTLPGWMVLVTTVHGKDYAVAVTADQAMHRYRVWIADKVPWGEWLGFIGDYSVRSGDHPTLYSALRSTELC